MFTAFISRVIHSLPRAVSGAMLSLLALGLTVCAQTQTPSPSQLSDDVLRIDTELVQTNVMVFDKRGQFVDGLKPEHFILTVNGEAKRISIFERVVFQRITFSVE